jgi:hypothetical protein
MLFRANSQLAKSGVSTRVRFCFAFLKVNERHRDFSTVTVETPSLSSRIPFSPLALYLGVSRTSEVCLLRKA